MNSFSSFLNLEFKFLMSLGQFCMVRVSSLTVVSSKSNKNTQKIKDAQGNYTGKMKQKNKTKQSMHQTSKGLPTASSISPTFSKQAPKFCLARETVRETRETVHETTNPPDGFSGRRKQNKNS